MKRDEVLDGRLLLEILPASMLCLETDPYACFKNLFVLQLHNKGKCS